jgi:hypothetical protein
MSIFLTTKLEARHDGDRVLIITAKATACCAQVVRETTFSGVVTYWYRTSNEGHIRQMWGNQDSDNSLPCDEQEFHDLMTEMIKHNALALPASERKTVLNQSHS